MMQAGKSNAQLIVEGKNDFHVISALCMGNLLPKTFDIIMCADNVNGGKEALLSSIQVRLKISGLTTLGIVIDADINAATAWQSVCNKLQVFGYDQLPQYPIRDGLVLSATGKPTIGIWLMPNNKLPGNLEDFVTYLIPESDKLKEEVNSVLRIIERKEIQRYPINRRSKALIHTWLAWQEEPGQPMGTAITARALSHEQPIAQVFVGWLRKLFSLENSVS